LGISKANFPDCLENWGMINVQVTTELSLDIEGTQMWKIFLGQHWPYMPVAIVYKSIALNVRDIRIQS
jgi:hypothetical protein